MKKIIVLAFVLTILLATLCGCAEKECEMCGDTYKGKSCTITLWGETGDVCKECHQEYLDFIGAK